MQHCRQLAGSIPFPEEPDTLDHNNTTVVMKHAGKEKAGTKRCVVLLLTHKYNYTAFGYVHSPYIRSAHCGSRVAHGSSVGEATGLLQLSVPTYRIFSNLIRTSSCRFLKRKKKVLGSSPHLSFNHPLPTRQTDSVMSDDGESDE
jgi:hypothetical protein